MPDVGGEMVPVWEAKVGKESSLNLAQPDSRYTSVSLRKDWKVQRKIPSLVSLSCAKT